MNKTCVLATSALISVLLVHGASAADWSGFYVGIHAGGVFGDVDVTGTSNDTNFVDIAPGETFGFSPDGVLGGAQLGYNLEMSGWLFGIELAGHGMDFDETTVVGGEPDLLSVESEWGASAALRLGFLFTPDSLLYLKGGYATGNIKTHYLDETGWEGSFSTDETHHGWVAGAGFEHAIGEHLSFGIEYNFIDLGNTDHSAVPVLGPGGLGDLVVNDVDVQLQTVTARLNWHFNPL